MSDTTQLRARRIVATTLGVMLAHPTLLPTALREMRRFAPRGWWRRWPLLPLPAAGLQRFRAETMYGDPEADLGARDLTVWLQWCRSQKRHY